LNTQKERRFEFSRLFVDFDDNSESSDDENWFWTSREIRHVWAFIVLKLKEELKTRLPTIRSKAELITCLIETYRDSTNR